MEQLGSTACLDIYRAHDADLATDCSGMGAPSRSGHPAPEPEAANLLASGGFEDGVMDPWSICVNNHQGILQ